jgi:hypothetical protein
MKQFLESEFCLTKCRMCCRFSQKESVWSPSVLDEEIGELSKQKISPSSFTKDKKISLVPFPEKDAANIPAHVGPIFVCPFLNMQDSKCSIYAARPFECQIYPFLINRRQDKVFLSVDPGCLYVKGKLSTKEFKEYAQYLFDILSLPEGLSKIRKNPQIIQVYEDALDLFEIRI